MRAKRISQLTWKKKQNKTKQKKTEGFEQSK